MAPSTDIGLLALRVLDLGGSAAARLAGRLLADLGADVVAVRPRGADPQWDLSKRVIERTLGEEALNRLAAGAQIVVDGRASAEAWLRTLAGVCLHLPSLPDGDDREVPAGVVEARAGAYQPPVGRARVHPLQVGALVTALHGAVAALATLRSGPRAALIRATELDGALHAQELRAAVQSTPATSAAALRWAASPLVGSYVAADGAHLFLHAGLPAHLDRLLLALERHGLDRGLRALVEGARRDPLELGSIAEARRVRAALVGIFRQRDGTFWEDTLAGEGVAAAVCRRLDEWRLHPQARATGQWQEVDGWWVPGPILDEGLRPRPILRVGPEEVVWRPATIGPLADEPPLRGVRVLDLSRIIAGPAAARTLSRLGATVEKVDDPRLALPWADLFRTLYDAGKSGGPVDLGAPAGRAALDALLATAPDVIVHSLRPAAAARLGLDAATLAVRVPRAVVATVSAYGSGGPWGGRPGWEQTAQAVTGAQWAYGGERPALVPIPAHDLCSGLALALGVVARLVGGEGGATSAALTRAAGWLWAPPSLEIGRAEYVAADPRRGPPFRVGRAGLSRALAARPEQSRRRSDGLTEVAAPWRGPGLARFSTSTAFAAGTGWRALSRGVGWGVYTVWRGLR